MIYTKFDALVSLKPNGEYTWTGTDYSGLVGSDKPTEAEIDARVALNASNEPMRQLRWKRDGLLFGSDWTQAADAPVDKEAWATYRQALRDLPANTEDPDNPVWPTQPGS